MKIFTVKGIDIKLHYSSLLIVFLVGLNAAFFYGTLNPAASQETLWLFGLASGLGVLISIIIHELMHSITAIHHGLEISEIELYFVGGVSKLKGEPKSANDEIKIAGIGPLTSIVLGISALGISFALNGALSAIGAFFLFLGQINLVLGLFNLIPAFPMDGGRVLRGILWKKRKDFKSATITAAKAGSGFGIALMVLGGLQLLLGIFSGIITLFIGYFLRSAAKGSVAQAVLGDAISRLTIEPLIERVPPISYNTSVDAVRNMFLTYRTPYLPLEYNGRIIGIVRYESLSQILAQGFIYDIVGSFSIPISKIPTVRLSDEIMSVVQTLDSSPYGLVVVLNEERNAIMGFIERSNLIAALRYA
jgi:Zn-dependent protease